MADDPVRSEDLTVGDGFTRRVGSGTRSYDMDMVVTEIIGDHLLANPTGENLGSGYIFHRVSGMEVNDDMSWGPNHGRTGSIILPGSGHSHESEPQPEDAAPVEPLPPPPPPDLSFQPPPPTPPPATP
jgi:hypothetical protein